jgi:hypothetical protein
MRMMATAVRRQVTDLVVTGGNSDDDGSGVMGDGAMGYANDSDNNDDDDNDDDDNNDDDNQRRR